jgi:hypothetical protein
MFATWKKRLTAAGIMTGVLILGSLSGPRHLLAQAKYALVRDVDEPGRGAFQTTVQVGFGTGLAGIPIPAGKRLIIDYVSIHGNASGTTGTTLPTILIESSINSQPSINYYISPVQIDPTIDQWRASQQVKIYADSLAIGVGYAGSVPFVLSFAVDVSGHLIDMP